MRFQHDVQGDLVTDERYRLADVEIAALDLRFRIEADGSLKFKQPYYTLAMLPFATRSGADGITVDSAGRLYCTSMAGLQMFDPTGRLGGVIAKPQKGSLSNVVFAGPKLDTLYSWEDCSIIH